MPNRPNPIFPKKFAGLPLVWHFSLPRQFFLRLPLEKNNNDLDNKLGKLEKEIEELKSEKDSTSSVTSGGCAAVKVGTKVILYRQIVFLVFCMSKTYDFSPFFLFFICNI